MSSPRLQPRILFGLGNPGPQYERTYHNAGMLAVDYLAKKSGGEKRQRPLFEYVKLSGLLLAKPKTFMNDSGRAVRAALGWFRAPRASLLLIHDEGDLPLGAWKLSWGRGAAGHKGVESVIAELGSQDFWRLRLGIRKPASGPAGRSRREKAGTFVLSRLTREEELALYRAVEEAMERCITNVTPPVRRRISERGSETD